MLSLILPAIITMQAPQPAPQYRIEKLRDNVYCVFGQGGNVGVIVGDDYLLLIDGQYERGLGDLLAAVKKISDKPIKYLINTHHHGDHTDANRMLSYMVDGIIAHTITRTRLVKEQENRDAGRKGGLPNILMGEADTKKEAGMSLALNSSEIYLTYLGPGHTDNDITVWVPSARVIHMGDLLFLERLPYIDTGAGGNFDSLIQVIAKTLNKLPDDALVIPGHGPTCDKKELTRHHSFLLAVQQHAKKNQGKTSKEMADSFDKEPWKDKEPSPSFVSWESLFDAATGRGPGRVVRN
jgi:glyoxylase-like metal-dependent hydrolase (beta-lactamase superfamily II)